MGAGRVGKGGSCWRGPTEDKGFASRATPTWAPAGRQNPSFVGVARRRIKALPARRRQHGLAPGGIRGALLAWPASGQRREDDVSVACERTKIGATRKTGGSNWGYKPPLLTRASRRGFSLCSSLSVISTLAAPKGAYLTNGSSYSFTLSLSTAISCFSWSLIYFLIVSSLRPTVLT